MAMKQNETIIVPGKVSEARFSKGYWSKLHRDIGRQEMVVLDMSEVAILVRLSFKCSVSAVSKIIAAF